MPKGMFCRWNPCPFIGFCLAVFSGLCGAGCAGLKLQLVDASVRKPSNVAVYFTVDTRGGEPVADLTPREFHIYEDGQPVSVLESKQTILQPEVAAIHYTLLLVDMSGSVVDSGDMPALIQAAASFADRVGPYQKVGDLHLRRQPAPDPAGRLRRQRARRHPRAGDAAARAIPSTNLNGAVIEGVRRAAPADGAARRCRCASARWWSSPTAPTAPHRAAPEDVEPGARLGAASRPTSSASAQEVDRGQLSRIGRSGTFASQNRADIQRGFDEIGARIEALVQALLPAVVLLAVARRPARGRDRGGRPRRRGAACRIRSTPSGFGPNCDPNQRPAFDVHHPRAIPPDAVAPPVAPPRPAAHPPGPPPTKEPSASAPIWQPKR